MLVKWEGQPILRNSFIYVEIKPLKYHGEGISYNHKTVSVQKILMIKSNHQPITTLPTYRIIQVGIDTYDPQVQPQPTPPCPHLSVPHSHVP